MTDELTSRDAELHARIAWSRVAEPGDGLANELIDSMGAPAALAAVLDPEARDRLARSLAKSFAENEVPTDPQTTLERWTARHRPADAARSLAPGVQAVIPGDEHWPARIDVLNAARPIMLWVRGDASLLSTRSVAIVGARACTSYGEQVTVSIAEDVALAGITVVSGAAYGVDAAAHRAALAVGGSTVAVLAGGVDKPYPAGNRELIGAIAERGLVVSEAPPGAVPTRHRFLMRQRLVAGLSGAVLVAEAGVRSGALQAAWHARSQGKPAGAVPGPVTSAASAGTNQMIRDGVATLVASGEQALQLLGEEDEA